MQAHLDEHAAAGAKEMGAQAFAQGAHVAFAGSPSLHTAAHEAAHVVQQRTGVHLTGGIGQAGDAYEQHADAVADSVVRGESAEPLLDAIPGTAASRGPAPDDGAGVQRKDLPKGEEGFETMKNAFPPNYQDDEEQNVDSPTVLDEHGLPKEYENTCAIRISVMLNTIGETITPAKAKAAGIRPPHYSKKTKQRYVLSAIEMWTYLTKAFRKPDVMFPANGRYQSAHEYDAGHAKDIKPAIIGKRGIVAFDKVFGYSGTGHVDIFESEHTFNAAGFYQSERVMIWYV